ncbi:MAG TPA: hypothetical protein VGA27_13325, partial [Candidatus Binatia bacterium]
MDADLFFLSGTVSDGLLLAEVSGAAGVFIDSSGCGLAAATSVLAACGAGEFSLLDISLPPRFFNRSS